MTEDLATVIARVQAAMVQGVEKPPTGEFGQVLVHVADLRRLITELEKHAAR